MWGGGGSEGAASCIANLRKSRPSKRPRYPVDTKEAGWTLQPVWMIRKQEILPLPGTEPWFRSRTAQSPVIIPTEL